MSQNKTITVLGKTFSSEEERREYFREELRRKLPGLKKMEGFPIGEDEDIIALSDPPYYTACPNPWLNDFVAEWEAEKQYISNRKEDFEVEGPFASDVSEGKNNPIYNAHSYHTKVPHPAIMRYILHYTQPGDIVFDGFAGTGMTGVAAQLCGKPDVEFKYLVEREFRENGFDIAQWGDRKALINDLSPIATFISRTYNLDLDLELFKKAATKILDEAYSEFGWMYETTHTNGRTGNIRFTVWSQVYSCPDCVEEIVFFEEAFNPETKKVKRQFSCPSCNAELTKKKLDKLYESSFDPATEEVIQVPKRKPVLIEYEINGERFQKRPDQEDLAKLEKISNLPLPKSFPSMKIPPMHMTHERARMDQAGITHIHHFFLPRPIQPLGAIWRKVSEEKDSSTKLVLFYFVEQAIWGLSILNRYSPLHFSQVNRYLNGVYYVASQHAECSPWYILSGKLKRLVKSFVKYKMENGNTVISTGSANGVPLLKNSIDYIFTDPPFGENIYYSDLNFLLESWHKVLTNARQEAIIDKFKHKTILDYHNLMVSSFEQYYSVLKPGKWMTVVFSNSSASVWNTIQTALQKVGFVLANVSAMNKKQGSYRQVTSTTAVKQDLVISCYKPSSEFDEKFKKSQYNEIGIKDFLNEHLSHLPIHIVKDNSTTTIIERNPKTLYDRLIAFYVQRGLPVPIDSGKFQQYLHENYMERDGMIFTSEQVKMYDRKKADAPNFIQMNIFIASEQDAIYWLQNTLEKSPKTEQDLHPLWMREVVSNIKKGDTLPELRTVLEENFLKNEAGAWYLPDPENEADLEKLRTNRLLKEFKSLRQEISSSKKKIKEVRVEAVRAGFKQCYQDKDFQTIVQVGDRIPGKILMEDEVLLQFYDIASSKV